MQKLYQNANKWYSVKIKKQEVVTETANDHIKYHGGPNEATMHLRITCHQTKHDVIQEKGREMRS